MSPQAACRLEKGTKIGGQGGEDGGDEATASATFAERICGSWSRFTDSARRPGDDLKRGSHMPALRLAVLPGAQIPRQNCDRRGTDR